MDSLSSAPGNRNSKNKLLSAVFAIAASVSGSVNAATTPNFTEEPAGSEKLVRIMSAQQAILDMLPLNHPSRQSITKAIENFKNGGDVSEITQAYNWAQAIVNSPSAPPAAKKEAQDIVNTLMPPLETGKSTPGENLIKGSTKSPIKVRDKFSETKEGLEMVVKSGSYGFLVFEHQIKKGTMQGLFSVNKDIPKGARLMMKATPQDNKGTTLGPDIVISDGAKTDIPEGARKLIIEIKFEGGIESAIDGKVTGKLIKFEMQSIEKTEVAIK